MDGDASEGEAAPRQGGPGGPGFGGERVVAFESRRADEMASLIERHGGLPMRAPALREVAIEQNEAALAFARGLRAGAFDAVVLMTGTGTRALVDEVAAEMDRAAFAAALSPGARPGGEPPAPRIIARGPKPSAALRELGVRGFITVPEPDTWREVAATLSGLGPLQGLRVAVLEHGAPSRELYEVLAQGGARVYPVRVYKWALPEDTAPLRSALAALAEGRARIGLFTSRSQVEHAFAVAGEEGIAAAVKEQLRRGLVGSIGPVCSDALRAEGLPPDVEPEHSKMGHLVKTVAERAAAILEAKGARLAGSA
jgi:uroporphyrinogen-III synthase